MADGKVAIKDYEKPRVTTNSSFGGGNAVNAGVPDDERILRLPRVQALARVLARSLVRALRDWIGGSRGGWRRLCMSSTQSRPTQGCWRDHWRVLSEIGLGGAGEAGGGSACRQLRVGLPILLGPTRGPVNKVLPVLGRQGEGGGDRRSAQRFRRRLRAEQV
eukprot:1791213-Pleurochrysis_carterae.AAC.1